MAEEELELQKELPVEPVLFHGTTSGRFNEFHQANGSYRDPSGNKVWLDEENSIPTVLGESYASEHDDDRIIIIARSDKLELEKSSNNSPKKRYWRANELPTGSYVYYNATKNEQGLLDVDMGAHIEAMKKLCEPLGVVPSYIKVWENLLKAKE